MGSPVVIPDPEVLAGPQEIGMHLRYTHLRVDELGELMGHLSRAYDALSPTIYVRPTLKYIRPTAKSGVHASVPGKGEGLSVERIETGKSILFICIGVTATVLHLAHVAKQMFETRKLYWESEKVKWEATEIKRRVITAANISAAQRKATTEIKQLIDVVNDSPNIKGFQLKIGEFVTIEHSKVD